MSHHFAYTFNGNACREHKRSECMPTIVIGEILLDTCHYAYLVYTVPYAIGEVGLTGEIRSVSNMNQRLQEVARLGFKKCIIPRNGSEKLDIPDGLTVYRVRNLREAIEVSL